MRQQTDTATHGASPAESRTTSPTCSADISPLAAFGLPAGIRTTAAYSAFPATFTERENSGFLDAVSKVSSRDELIRLCKERDTLERTRWQSWWKWHECSRRVREFSPVASEWYIRPEDRDEVEELRALRIEMLSVDTDYRAYDRDRIKRHSVSARLHELTGHHGFTLK